ncbi:MAG: protein kinase [Planctomycetaceae bacterium]
MALSVAQLSEHLIRSGLLPEEQIKASAQSVGGLTEESSAEGLAKQLVRDGRLTLFQAQLAINGKAAALVLGSYLILEKLGQGGMGQVYKARHRTMKREVALKVISAAVVKDETSLRRFQREVEAAAQLNHPNIVTAHDAGEHKGTHFLVMELVRGADLASTVKKSGPMKPAQAVHCVLQAARGLAYAHNNGIVHRDIKPANLLLDESGTIKILDMGLARFEEAGQDHASVAGLTGTGMLMGTIDYMSPEQAMDSKTADARSDIYSLGCTLYFLLTGQAVYVEDTVMKRIMAHQIAAIPRLPILNNSLQAMFEKMIAKKPEQRYQSAASLANDLQSWLTAIESDREKATAEMPLAGVGAWDVPEDVSFRGESEPQPGIAIQTRTETRPVEPQPETTPYGSVDQVTMVPSSAVTTSAKKPVSRQALKSSEMTEGSNGSPPSRRPGNKADNKPRISAGAPAGRGAGVSKSLGRWTLGKMLAVCGGGVFVVLMGVVMFRMTGKGGLETIAPLPDGTPEVSAVVSNADSKTAGAEQEPDKLPDSADLAALAIAETDQSPLHQNSDVPSSLQPKPDPPTDTAESVKLATEMPESATEPSTVVAASTASMAVSTLPDTASASESSRGEVISLAGTLAPSELRLKERSPGLPTFKSVLRPGQPLGEFAAVSSPGRVESIISWSIEPLQHRAMVQCLDVNVDGLIATGGSDNSVRIWTRDWQLLKVLPGHANAVCAVAFSPDGKSLASISSDRNALLALWNVDSGQLLANHALGHWFGQLAWLPDGQWIARAGRTGIEMINPWTGEKREADASVGLGMDIASSPDGSQLICTIQDDNPQLIDTLTQKPIRNIDAIIGGTAGTGGSCDWSKDGKWIVLSSLNRTCVLDTRSFQIRTEWPFGGFPKFSPDSTTLAVANTGKISFFSSMDWSLVREFPAHISYDSVWSTDGRQMLTSNGTYDARTGQPMAHPALSATSLVVSAVSSDGRRVATISNSRLRLWDGANGQLLNESPQDHSSPSQFIWQPQGSKVLKVISSRDPVPSPLTLIDGETGKTLNSPVVPPGMIWRAAWSSDGKRFASVGEDGSCRIWDADSATELQKLTHVDPVWWVQWSNDGTRVATGASSSVISVWDVATGKLLREFKTLSQPLRPPLSLPAADGPFGFMKGDTQLFYLVGDAGFEVLDLRSGQISSLGQVDHVGGNRQTAAWSKDFGLLGVYDGYKEFHLYAAGDTKPVTSIRYFSTPHWLADGKRLLGGDNWFTWLCGYDLRRKKRVGVLIPELGANSWAALSSDGHFVGSSDVTDQLVVVAMHRDGRLLTMTMEEFQTQFKWGNDPQKVRFLD